MSKEKIFVGIDNERIELKGAELEAFLAQRAKDQAEKQARLEQELALKETKIAAYKKLGLTDEEIAAII